MTQGRKAFKSKFYIGDGASPEVFTKIDEVFSIGPLGGTRPTVNMTSHDTLEYEDLLGFDLKDGNEIQVQANDIVSNASQALIWAADDGDQHNFRWVDRNGSGRQFPGIITQCGVDPSDLRGKVAFTFTVKIVGALTSITVAP